MLVSLTRAHSKDLPTNSLERALLILESVAREKRGLTNKDLSGELGIATSSCSYILERLERNGYLARDPDSGRYSIGLKVVAIARGALRPFDFRKVAEPVLKRVSDQTGLETAAGVLDQGQLMVLLRVSNGKFPRADVDTGSEFPAQSTAMGKVLLAHLPPQELAELIERTGLAPRTDRTIVSKEKLIEELNQVRQRGYATTDEEHELGMRSVGVPISGPWGKIDAALAAIGKVRDIAWGQNLEATVRLLQDAAREISARRRSGSDPRSIY